MTTRQAHRDFFDIYGIIAIHCGGRDLFAINQPVWNNTKRPYRIAELALEPDYGDPWGRRIPPPSAHDWNDMSIVGLGDYHTSVEASNRAIRWTGKYDGGDFKVKKLEWTMIVTPSPDGRRMDLSLVRSPEWGFGLAEPGSYEFWDFDGMRDTGRHRFEYSLFPYVNGLSIGDLTRMGYAYNIPPLQLPFKVEGEVVVTAWKLAEDGDGWILRVQEAAGKGTRVVLKFKEPHEVTVTNLLEKPNGRTRCATSHSIRLHRHGILTLRICF